MLKNTVGTSIPHHPEQTTTLESRPLRQLLQAIFATRSDQIGCERCFEQLDCFVEKALTGGDLAEAMPLVEDHLKRCGDCREEFEALLVALYALT